VIVDILASVNTPTGLVTLRVASFRDNDPGLVLGARCASPRGAARRCSRSAALQHKTLPLIVRASMTSSPWDVGLRQTVMSRQVYNINLRRGRLFPDPNSLNDDAIELLSRQLALVLTALHLGVAQASDFVGAHLPGLVVRVGPIKASRAVVDVWTVAEMSELARATSQFIAAA
jgi:hypothetical protein